MTFTVKRRNVFLHMSDEFFSSSIAKRYGLLEAVVLANVSRLVADASESERRLGDDGVVYVRCTPKILSEFMGYATEHQIRRALDKLATDGAIKREKLTASALDRSHWVAIGEVDYE